MRVKTALLKAFDSPINLLILTSGFEDRCLAILDYLEKKDIQNTHIILLNYLEQDDTEVNVSNKKNERIFKKFLNKNKLPYIKIILDHEEPINTFIEFKKYFHQNLLEKNIDNILFDISTAKDSIIAMFTVFLLKLEYKRINFVYTLPKTYNLVQSYQQYENSDDFLIKILENYYNRVRSPNKVEPFVGFEGFPDPNQPTRVIFLAGFDVNKVLIVLKRFEDSWVTSRKILIGRSNFLDNDAEKDYSYFLHEKLTKDIVDDISFIECHNVSETMSALENLIIPYLQTENIVLCCFGTKLQMLASVLFTIKYPKVSLLQVQMKKYFPKYFSKGIKKSLYVSITND